MKAEEGATISPIDIVKRDLGLWLRNFEEGGPTIWVLAELYRIIEDYAEIPGVDPTLAMLKYDKELDAILMARLIELNGEGFYAIPSYPRISVGELRERAGDPDGVEKPLRDIERLLRGWSYMIHSIPARHIT